MNAPSGWKKIKFGKIAKEKSKRIDNPGKSGLERYVGLEHLDSGMLTVKRWGSTQDVNSAMKLFTAGDILFARRNTYLRRASVAKFDGVCSGDIIVIEPILDEIVEGFLPLYMQFEPFENKIISLSAGAFSKRIKWKQLVEEEILIPSKEEQQKFVDLIWSIEDNIEKTENLIALNEKLKKGLLDELLVKGIGIKKFKKTKIGEIPEKWDLVKLIDLVEHKDQIVAGPFGSNLKVKDYVSEGYPIIQLQNIERNKFLPKKLKFTSEAKFQELKYHSFVSGDIVLAKLGDPIGKTCIVPKEYPEGLVTSDVVRIRLDYNKINKLFIVYFLNSDFCLNQFIKGTVGTTRPRVNLNDVRDLDVPLPPLEEQKIISKKIACLDKSITSENNNLFSLNNLKKKLTNSILGGNYDGI